MSGELPPIKSPDSPSRKGPPKDCDECGRRFRPWVNGGRFCSVQCRTASWSRRTLSLRSRTQPPGPTVSAERMDAIRAEAAAAFDNLRKRVDG
jgi:hypothetical protein